jgi:predicted component of type VI protein secretion system
MTMPGKRRRACSAVLILMFVAMLTFLIGCGSSSHPSGTPQGNYAIAVTGTAGNVTESTTFYLHVQ